MFFKKILLIFCALTLTFSISGCNKSTSVSSQEVSDETLTDEELLSTAFELFNAEEKRGTITTYTTTYEDDSTQSETEKILYDTSSSVLEKSYTTSSGDTEVTLYVKDEQDVYCYENDNSFEEGWVRYLENPDEANETGLDHALAEFSYSFDESSGYSDITIKNEGTELLNGIDVIKLTVSAVLTPDTDDATDESPKSGNGSVTRKSLIAEYGWSEESVTAVEGFSELLDHYVAYLNNEDVKEINNEEPVETYTFWIDAASTQILQASSTFSVENTSIDTISNVEEEFWDNSWKVDWIQSDIDAGLTLEEAKLILELEGAYMEEQMEYEESLNLKEDDISETGSYAKEGSYVKVFLTGDNCPSTMELPASYVETTSEDYYNAFE